MPTYRPDPPSDDRWLHWITLYTDGSYSTRDGGFFAFRARHSFPPFVVEESGRAHNEAQRDSLVAEMWAILKGVDAVLKTWERVDGIGVRTDCEQAMRILSFGAKPHRRPDIRQMQVALHELLSRKSKEQGRECRIRIRWVKGHQHPDDSTQAWCNNRVDALAGRARRR